MNILVGRQLHFRELVSMFYPSGVSNYCTPLSNNWTLKKNDRAFIYLYFSLLTLLARFLNFNGRNIINTRYEKLEHSITFAF